MREKRCGDLVLFAAATEDSERAADLCALAVQGGDSSALLDEARYATFAGLRQRQDAAYGLAIELGVRGAIQARQAGAHLGAAYDVHPPDSVQSLHIRPSPSLLFE